MALNSQSHHSFYMDPIVPCFWCVQVIEIHLLFSIIKELVDILPKTPRNPHLSTKKGEKIDLSRKGLTSFFLLFSPSFYTWPTQKDAIEKLAQPFFFTCALVLDQYTMGQIRRSCVDNNTIIRKLPYHGPGARNQRKKLVPFSPAMLLCLYR